MDLFRHTVELGSHVRNLAIVLYAFADDLFVFIIVFTYLFVFAYV